MFRPRSITFLGTWLDTSEGAPDPGMPELRWPHTAGDSAGSPLHHDEEEMDLQEICSEDPSIDTVKDENGKFISDTNEKIKQWAKHFENLLNRPTANPASLNIRSQSLAQADTNPPSPEEIMLAIAKLKTNKAAGDDKLPPELFIYGMHELLPHFQDLLLSIWNNEKIPDDWKTAVIVPIHKKGDKANCANYRGISLLSKDTSSTGRPY